MLAMLSFMKVTSCEILTPACLNSVAIMVTQPSTVGLEPKGGEGGGGGSRLTKERGWVLVGNFEKNP